MVESGNFQQGLGGEDEGENLNRLEKINKFNKMIYF